MHVVMHSFWECCIIVNIISNLLFLLLNFTPPQAMGQEMLLAADSSLGLLGCCELCWLNVMSDFQPI